MSLDSVIFNSLCFAEASESFAVEDTMSSITERWLLVEELLTQRSAKQQEDDCLVKAKHCEKEIDVTLSVVNKLSCVEERNVETLSKLKVMIFSSFFSPFFNSY